jgi:hypothetical protein
MVAAVKQPFIEAVNLIKHRFEKCHVGSRRLRKDLPIVTIVKRRVDTFVLGVDRTADQSEFTAEERRGDGREPIIVGLQTGVAERNNVAFRSATSSVTLVRNGGRTPKWAGKVYPSSPRMSLMNIVKSPFGRINDNTFRSQGFTLRSQ